MATSIELTPSSELVADDKANLEQYIIKLDELNGNLQKKDTTKRTGGIIGYVLGTIVIMAICISWAWNYSFWPYVLGIIICLPMFIIGMYNTLVGYQNSVEYRNNYQNNFIEPIWKRMKAFPDMYNKK